MSIDVDKVRETARTPTYSGTTTSSWSAPDLEDYGYDSVEDMSDDVSPHPAEHTLLGEKDGETWSKVSILPVVEPNGNLNKSALESAKGYASQVDGISANTVENVKEKADMLLREEFDVETEQEKIIKLITKNYSITESEASEFLDTIPEIQKEMKEMEKEELIDTVKKVRDDEMEMSKALDEFVDVDSETIKEIKEELDKEEPEEEEETEKDEDGEDKDVEKIIDEKAEKLMEEEDELTKSKAMEKVLEDDPDLYEKYKMRGV